MQQLIEEPIVDKMYARYQTYIPRADLRSKTWYLARFQWNT